MRDVEGGLKLHAVDVIRNLIGLEGISSHIIDLKNEDHRYRVEQHIVNISRGEKEAHARVA